MDLGQRFPGQGRTPETLADIARITALWTELRQRFGVGGPFLFGHFSGADCMFAPVVTRFETYAVELDPVCRAYADAVLNLPSLVEWTAAARRS
jgi:glutathione S-transferase